MCAQRWIPYGRQSIDDSDIEAVCSALQSDFLTTGPAVEKFEGAVSQYCEVEHGIAVSSGTAALHCCMYALGIAEDDEVIVPPITFAATANCVRYQGGRPVFADVEAETLLIDPHSVEKKITPRTKAIIAVDYAGQACDWEALRRIADKHSISLVADACHALGAEYNGTKVGGLADLTVLSFHPVKHIATGEGGMVLTDDLFLARRVRMFRSHGIESDFRTREKNGAWHYDMVDLGYNYRLTDIQAALGANQMTRLESFLLRRREIAAKYDAAFAGSTVEPLKLVPGRNHAYHLYVVKVSERERVFSEMREAGVGVNVHYIPVHYHPYYKQNLGTGPGMCPIAEECYEKLLSLPIFPGMSDDEVDFIVDTLLKAVGDRS